MAIGDGNGAGRGKRKVGTNWWKMSVFGVARRVYYSYTSVGVYTVYGIYENDNQLHVVLLPKALVRIAKTLFPPRN